MKNVKDKPSVVPVVVVLGIFLFGILLTPDEPPRFPQDRPAITDLGGDGGGDPPTPNPTTPPPTLWPRPDCGATPTPASPCDRAYCLKGKRAPGIGGTVICLDDGTKKVCVFPYNRGKPGDPGLGPMPTLGTSGQQQLCNELTNNPRGILDCTFVHECKHANEHVYCDPGGEALGVIPGACNFYASEIEAYQEQLACINKARQGCGDPSTDIRCNALNNETKRINNRIEYFNSLLKKHGCAGAGGEK